MKSYAHEVPTDYILRVKNEVHNEEKVTKITMKKTNAKFQNDRYKTVRGVALTRGTHYI